MIYYFAIAVEKHHKIQIDVMIYILTCYVALVVAGILLISYERMKNMMKSSDADYISKMSEKHQKLLNYIFVRC